LTNNWGNSYAEAAYAYYAAGQTAGFAAEIPEPVKNIHFAGEYSEFVAPAMDAVLTPGKRSAAEVLAAIAA
jgi:monoamine oxidase